MSDHPVPDHYQANVKTVVLFCVVALQMIHDFPIILNYWLIEFELGYCDVHKDCIKNEKIIFGKGIY